MEFVSLNELKTFITELGFIVAEKERGKLITDFTVLRYENELDGKYVYIYEYDDGSVHVLGGDDYSEENKLNILFLEKKIVKKEDIENIIKFICI